MLDNSSDILRIFPFQGYKSASDDPAYQTTLKLLSTLQHEFSRILEERRRTARISLDAEKIHLPDNMQLASKEAIEQAKKELLETLESLYIWNEQTPPITIIRDSCFTNRILELRFLDMFSVDACSRYIKHIDIDYNDPSSAQDTEKHIPPNSIILIPWSFSDTYSIDPLFYQSSFAKLLGKSVSNLPDEENRRIIGICFGQQLLANLVGMNHPHSQNIVATIQWAAEFMPSKCKLHQLQTVPEIYRNALRWVSAFGKNTDFTWVFTRTWHVHFDMFNAEEWELIVPLMVDSSTQDIVGWGTKNGRVLAVQFHPEIDLAQDKELLLSVMKEEVIPSLKKNYGEIIEFILHNFELGETNIAGLHEQFYIFALLAFAKDILAQKNASLLEQEARKHIGIIDYKSSTEALMQMLDDRFNSLLQRDSTPGFNQITSINRLEKLDILNKLALNARFDWKVNRWEKECSEMLGIQNLSEMVQEHVIFLEDIIGRKWPYIFRDWGAGNGTLLKELYQALQFRDIIFYGVGDNVYFDLYQWLKKSTFTKEMPEEIVILFTQKVIIEYNKIVEERRKNDQTEQAGTQPLLNDLYNAVANAELGEGDHIQLSSMFSEKTFMFTNEDGQPLSEESKKFLRENSDQIHTLKYVLAWDFYSFFDGFFERIYVADFLDFSPSDKRFERADFQVAIRSTSHIDSEEYCSVLRDYISHFSQEGGIFLDNGVHRSYSGIARLNELYEVGRDFGEAIQITLYYHSKKQTFQSAIIQKAPFQSDVFFEKHRASDICIVPLEEAIQSTHFRIDTFIRSLLMASFRDYNVFRHFGHQIPSVINICKELLIENDLSGAKMSIISFVNSVGAFLNERYKKRFNAFTPEMFDDYERLSGKTLNSIWESGIIEFDWFNAEEVSED